MATSLNNLSSYDKEDLPNGADCKIGIVVSEWNNHITSKLLEGTIAAFLENGVLERNIKVYRVPGAFELPLGAQWLLSRQQLDGIVVIGAVIQGETRHFDFVCNGATHGIMDVMLKHNKPVAFCLLTDNTEQQSLDRAGGKHGNKGVESAITLLRMIGLEKTLR